MSDIIYLYKGKYRVKVIAKKPNFWIVESMEDMHAMFSVGDDWTPDGRNEDLHFIKKGRTFQIDPNLLLRGKR